jgi:hypothetical protein
MLPQPEGDEKGVPYPQGTVHCETEERHDIAEASDDEDITYPEGGLRAWLVVFGSFCGMYVTSNPAVSCRQRLTMAKASLLRLHEQHQHLQHLPIDTPTISLQRKLNRMDFQHVHLPDLLVRHLHWTHLRCQRAAASGLCRKRVDDGEYYAHGDL